MTLNCRQIQASSIFFFPHSLRTFYLLRTLLRIDEQNRHGRNCLSSLHLLFLVIWRLSYWVSLYVNTQFYFPNTNHIIFWLQLYFWVSAHWQPLILVQRSLFSSPPWVPIPPAWPISSWPRRLCFVSPFLTTQGQWFWLKLHPLSGAPLPCRETSLMTTAYLSELLTPHHNSPCCFYHILFLPGK